MKIVKLSNFTIRLGARCFCWECPKNRWITSKGQCAFHFMCFTPSKHHPLFLNYKN